MEIATIRQKLAKQSEPHDYIGRNRPRRPAITPVRAIGTRPFPLK